LPQGNNDEDDEIVVGCLIAKQMFSMPEAALGLHTDCGSSFWLSRLPGHLGRVSPPYIKTQQ
jgi:enoyl-CoA hydratase/carnithine racemase